MNYKMENYEIGKVSNNANVEKLKALMGVNEDGFWDLNGPEWDHLFIGGGMACKNIPYSLKEYGDEDNENCFAFFYNKVVGKNDAEKEEIFSLMLELEPTLATELALIEGVGEDSTWRTPDFTRISTELRLEIIVALMPYGCPVFFKKEEFYEDEAESTVCPDHETVAVRVKKDDKSLLEIEAIMRGFGLVEASEGIFLEWENLTPSHFVEI